MKEALTDEINPQIIVAEHENTYLIYDGSKYYLGFVQKEKTITTTALNIKSTPESIAIILDNGFDIKKLEKKSDNTPVETDIIFLHGQINSKIKKNSDKVLNNLFRILSEIIEELDYYSESRTNKNIINNITDEKIINQLKTISNVLDIPKYKIVTLATVNENTSIIQIEGNKHQKDGLYYEYLKQNKKGEIETEYKFIGNLLILNLKLTYDKLKNRKGEALFPPVATIKYKNTITNQVLTIEKKPFEVIADNLLKNRLIDSNSQGTESIINSIWVNGVNDVDFITADTDLLKDGFFMDLENNKVLSNNVFEKLETTSDDVNKAITLFNEIIDNRGTAIPNDCLLFRFMLWSPFAYCLKQLGFIDGLYSMVLWGVTDTSKTGSAVNFSYLYSDMETTLQKANTQSAMGTRLGENTFPLILDENKDILSDPKNEEFLKNIVTDEIGRSVKDRANNNIMNDFPALRATVSTLNADLEYKAEFIKRYHVLYYDMSMQVTEKAKKDFNKKFKPKSRNTPLKQLKHLGKAFADKFIPYLETQSDELYDLDKLTIKILEEINKEHSAEFNINVFLEHKDRLTTQSTDNAVIIKSELNKKFKRAYKLPYGREKYEIIDFINSTDTGAIAWLDYQPKNELFLIKMKEFEKDISDIVGQHFPIAEIMKLLSIRYDDNEGKNIKFKGSSTKGIKLNTYNLTYKLFNIRVTEFEDLEEEEKETIEIEREP